MKAYLTESDNGSIAYLIKRLCEDHGDETNLDAVLAS